jgi:hypothetical protein
MNPNEFTKQELEWLKRKINIYLSTIHCELETPDLFYSKEMCKSMKDKIEKHNENKY